MKNTKKRGFTLIELLAVIVILAIIALVATPIVLNMINSARKKSAESSAYGFIDAIEYNNGFAQSEQPGYTEINGTNLDATSIDVKMKGKKPTSGTVTIESGKVTSANLCVEGYTVVYNGREVTSTTKGCSNSSSSEETTPTPTVHKPSVTNVSGATHKGIVYMNPTDLTEECTASNSVSTTGTKTGCMKFYIYDDSGDTYKMILDHNTTAKVAYETSGTYKEYEQATIKSTVDSDTTGWVGSPKLITAQEIATITNTTTFDGSSSTYFFFNGTGTNKQTQASSSQGDNEYAWLFDYTNGCTDCGCNTADSSNNGYWTSSSVSDSSNVAWVVVSGGGLFNGDVDSDSDGFGVRPVITLNKTDIN